MKPARLAVFDQQRSGAQFNRGVDRFGKIESLPAFGDEDDFPFEIFGAKQIIFADDEQSALGFSACGERGQFGEVAVGRKGSGSNDQARGSNEAGGGDIHRLSAG